MAEENCWFAKLTVFAGAEWCGETDEDEDEWMNLKMKMKMKTSKMQTKMKFKAKIMSIENVQMLVK